MFEAKFNSADGYRHRTPPPCYEPSWHYVRHNPPLARYSHSSNDDISRIDILDAQAQKLYLSKAPEHNPFGNDEEPLKFQDLDVFTKVTLLRILHQE